MGNTENNETTEVLKTKEEVTEEAVEETVEEAVEEKVEEKKEETSEETKEEPSEEKKEETKEEAVEEKTEEKTEETKGETAEEKVDEKPEEKTEEKPDVKPEEKIEEIKVEEPIVIKVENDSVGKKIYSWLNSGVSHSLPFVVGGGLLIAIAYLIDMIAGYSAIGGGDFGNVTPLAALFKFIGELTLCLMVPVLAGYIAYAIAGKPGLAVGLVGGILASFGNAPLAGYLFADGKLIDGEKLGGFSKFLTSYIFQQPKGSYTVSGYLGGILAGILAGFLVLGLLKICENFPDSLEGFKNSFIIPFFGILVEGVVMCFIFNPLVGLASGGLNTMLKSMYDAGMLTMLCLILGMMMAIDMGGLFNKTAYMFGVGMLAKAAEYVASGKPVDDPKVVACYISMAAIMVGGMVPPVGIALACWIFPKKFTKEERGMAIPNVIMGASFITEGAIPFAAADPLRVIPSAVVGSAVASCMVGLFKCNSLAPQGGLFVYSAIESILLFVVSWLVGSAITCVMLGLIKKEVEESE